MLMASDTTHPGHLVETRQLLSGTWGWLFLRNYCGGLIFPKSAGIFIGQRQIHVSLLFASRPRRCPHVCQHQPVCARGDIGEHRGRHVRARAVFEEVAGYFVTVVLMLRHAMMKTWRGRHLGFAQNAEHTNQRVWSRSP